MLRVAVRDDEIRVGARFCVAFQRTLRIPDDGKTYPLPPGLGRLPIFRVEDYAARVPAAWRERGGFFIPMYQREALWLAFDGALWKPNAVQVGVGGIDAVAGGAWTEKLSADPQNYLVCPDQPWLDGINSGEGTIRQFVAMPLGLGYTVEGQLTGREEVGGLQLRVYEPKPGRFPDTPPRRAVQTPAEGVIQPMRQAGAMGLGAGGRMRQKIYPDAYGLDTWDTKNSVSFFVHIINSEQFREVTGQKPPVTPISAKTYTEHGFPWFELYDEAKRTLGANKHLSRVKSVREKDAEAHTDAGAADEVSIDLRKSQVQKIEPSKTASADKQRSTSGSSSSSRKKGSSKSRSGKSRSASKNASKAKRKPAR